MECVERLSPHSVGIPVVFCVFFCPRRKNKQTAVLKLFSRNHDIEGCYILSGRIAHQLPDKKRITPSTHP